MTICFLTTIAVHLEFVSPLALYLNFKTIFQHYQVWRLFTNFVFFDSFNLNFVFHMFFTIQHSRRLEETSFRGRTGDYFFMWLFMGVLLLLSQLFLYYVPLSIPKAPFLASSLAFAVVYVWSRRNRHTRMSFFGPFHFYSSISSLGYTWIWIFIGTESPFRFIRTGSGTHILFFRRCLSDNIPKQKITKDSRIYQILF